jgi:hypothetical protein
VDDDMTLAEQVARLRQQVARLRQLAAADPNTTLLELAIINGLEEVTKVIEVIQELRGNDPPVGLGSG